MQGGPHPALAALVPLPRTVEPGDGWFVLDDGAHVSVPGDAPARGVGEHLAADLHLLCRRRTSVVVDHPAAAGDLQLVVRPHRATDDDLGPEGYELVVSVDGVRLEAATAHGLWNGTRTLVQLLDDGTARLPVVRVVDRPRFEWRGAMLDVARHFFTVDHVTRLVELIARYRMNRLHLHLSDDQGWRLEIPGRPALTTVGGSTSCGGEGGGWYTLDDWRVIVDHAERHFVTIVPEIDLPGHTNAALASVPGLNPDGVARPLYTGKEVGFSSLRLDLPETRPFLRDVIGTLAAHTPGPWLHVGGDEAHSTDRTEYLAFVDVLQQEVAAHGKHMIGWEEIAAARLDPSTLVQHWLRPDTVMSAPANRVVMSPARHTYLDMKHTADDRLGRRWAGTIDLDTAYEWDPAGLLPDVDDAGIAGVEAPLWTEKVRTFQEIEELCFPRLACVAEVGWTPQAQRDWATFRPRLTADVRRLRARGVQAYRSALLDD